MRLKIYQNEEVLSVAAAQEIVTVVKYKPEAVLCLATGDTPRLTYNKLVESQADFSRCTFIGLDEWVGIAPDNEGSCHFFLKEQIFGPLQIAAGQIHLFNPLSKDLEDECRKMDAVISTKGGIDLMLVGVGMNGHIGFNEPGTSAGLHAHVVTLDAITRSVGQKYFRTATKLHNGITLGLQHLMESRSVIMMACGAKKADIITKALDDPITSDVPASIIRKHTNSVVMVDEAAAMFLRNR